MEQMEAKHSPRDPLPDAIIIHGDNAAPAAAFRQHGARKCQGRQI
jgi:hypothetical protein